MSKKTLTLEQAKALRKQLYAWLELDLTPENLVKLFGFMGEDTTLGRLILPNSEVAEDEPFLISYEFHFKESEKAVDNTS